MQEGLRNGIAELQGSDNNNRASQTTDSNLRYAAYATRLRTILLSAHRYVAYTSDIGESFRPVAHPYLIRGAYGISWLYLAGDVSHEGYKAYLRNQRIKHPGVPGTMAVRSSDAREALPHVEGKSEIGHVPAIDDFRSVMVQRAVFQGIASMGLPAFTIHSIVRYSGRALKDAKNKTIRSYGPIGVRPSSSNGPDLSLTCSIAWSYCRTLLTLHI